MRHPRSTARCLALLSLVLAVAACKQADSVLLVTVDGPRGLGAFRFSVNVSSGTETHNILVAPETPEPINLPASFTISLDRSHAGPITITVDAQDELGETLASGTTTMQHIQIGAQTLIDVTLVPVPPAGAGSDGGAGAGGGMGAGGASGQGGASGSAGSSDGGDAMGLDGATG